MLFADARRQEKKSGGTMADTIVERVARILCREDGDDPERICRGEKRSAGTTYRSWQAYVSVARRIVAAKRDPEDGMVDAGFDAELDEEGDMAPRNVWEAMIDEAQAGKHRSPA
jgi:hypothetical protein